MVNLHPQTDRRTAKRTDGMEEIAEMTQTSIQLTELLSHAPGEIFAFLERIGPIQSAFLATIAISIVPIFLLFILAGLKSSGLAPKSEAIRNRILNVIVCFAVGGMLGDAFLHLIPHALEGQMAGHRDHSHHHDHHHHHHHDHHQHHHHDHDHSTYNIVGIQVLLGMLGFFLIERFARLTGIAHDHSHHHHHHHHSHAHSKQEGRKVDGRKSKKGRNRVEISESSPAEGKEHRTNKKGQKKVSSKNPPTARDPEKIQGSQEENRANPKKPKKGKKKTKMMMKMKKSSELPQMDHGKVMMRKNSAMAGFLNIVADVTHNFTDGLAIAGSFMVGGTAVGISTTLAVLLHEVPHELGDYAILLQAGYSNTAALSVQFLTAFGALLGCLIGVLSSNGFPEITEFWMTGKFPFPSFWGGESIFGCPHFSAGEGTMEDIPPGHPDIAARGVEMKDFSGNVNWILPVTAGGFIYIALTNVVPTLFEADGRSDAQKTRVSEFLWLVVEVGAMVLGVGLMVLIGEME